MSLLPICLSLSAVAGPPLSETLEKAREEHDLPAMTAAVVNSEGLIESAAVGVRKAGGEEPVTVEDRFALGSCTKSFTATLIASLIEDGTLRGDMRLGEIFAGGLKGARRTNRVHPQMAGAKIDELLAHTSGMIADAGNSPAWIALFTDKRPARVSRRELVAEVLAQPPGGEREKYEYSNLGYVTLAVIAEEATGSSYEELVTERILKPLGLESAVFRTNETARAGDVWGHDDDGEPGDPTSSFAENPAAFSPAGTLHMNVLDWARWARWHLAGDPAPVLNTQDAYDRMHEPLTGPDAGGNPYGHGWILLETPNGPAYTHGGSNTAFFSLIWVLPKRDVAVVVLTNQGSGFPACDAVAGQAMQQFGK